MPCGGGGTGAVNVWGGKSLRTREIGQDAAIQRAAENGGKTQERSAASAKFSEVLQDLIGAQGAPGIDTNPLGFAPAPVGTEVKLERPVEVEEQEAEVAEDDYLKQDVQEESAHDEQLAVNEEVKEEVVVEEVVVEEATEEEFLQVVEAETERMVQEGVEKESTAGQGTPEVVTESVATESIDVTRQERMIGSASQEGQNNQAWTPKQEVKVVVDERQKVDMSVPKELEQQVNAMQEAASKEKTSAKLVGPEMKTEAQIKEMFSGSTREVGTGEEKAPEAVQSSPMVNAVVQQSNLPKGSEAEQSLRFQLGSLLRPESLADKALQQGAARGSSAGGSGITSIVGNSSEKEKLAGESSRAKAKPQQLPKNEQDKVVERVKELLKDANATRNGNTMVVRLDPPRLGQMMVKVTHKAGQVHARIVPESQEVETALRSRVSELTTALTAIGIKAENIHISLGAERTESEAFQFSEFLNQNGSQGSGEREFSHQREEKHATLPGSMTTTSNRGGEAVAGWVA